MIIAEVVFEFDGGFVTIDFVDVTLPEVLPIGLALFAVLVALLAVFSLRHWTRNK